MPIDVNKIRSLSDEARRREEEKERRYWEGVRQANEEYERKLQEDQRRKQKALAQHAKGAIGKIPQIIEAAARKGKRTASVYQIKCDDLSPRPRQRVFRSLFGKSPYVLEDLPDFVRAVYDYCDKQGLSPEFHLGDCQYLENREWFGYHYEIRVSW